MPRDDEDLKRSLVETLWGKDAAYYDAARSHVLEAAASEGEYGWIREQLPLRGRVLEIGCGEGSNMEVLATEGLEWFGGRHGLSASPALAPVRRSHNGVTRSTHRN